MANLKVSENPLPFLPFTETVDPSNPVAGGQRLFVDTDHLLKMVDSSGTVTTFNTAATVTDATISTSDVTTNNASTTKHGWLKKLDNVSTHFMDGTGAWSTPAGTGAVASDAIWDAAGDLAVGSGADTAARLAKGAAGAYLSTYNGTVAWNGGTSFPASPTTGDRYWRSDDGMEFYYDGTRWLSTQVFRTNFINREDVTTSVGDLSRAISASGDGGRVGAPSVLSGSDLYLIELKCTFKVNSGGTALSGSHKWVAVYNGLDSSDASTGTIQTLTVDSGSSGVRRVSTLSVAAVQAANTLWYQPTITKTGTPGTFELYTDLYYRIVET